MFSIAASTEKVSVVVAVPSSDIDDDELFRLMNTIPDSSRNVMFHISNENGQFGSAFDFVSAERFHPKNLLA